MAHVEQTKPSLADCSRRTKRVPEFLDAFFSIFRRSLSRYRTSIRPDLFDTGPRGVTSTPAIRDADDGIPIDQSYEGF